MRPRPGASWRGSCAVRGAGTQWLSAGGARALTANTGDGKGPAARAAGPFGEAPAQSRTTNRCATSWLPARSRAK
jgi:hypothetical protein